MESIIGTMILLITEHKMCKNKNVFKLPKFADKPKTYLEFVIDTMRIIQFDLVLN